ncbi:MAG: Aspartyl/asparaginyl beta-hydroxylase [Acidobacteria bacterium]|nr:Aspartyl/asparaginyl beta-hydroxylase [Acidobacteriota bacterium]
MISKSKLPFAFDPQLLKADLEQVAPDEWVAHFNKEYFEGEWTGVALRSLDGLTRRISSPPANRSTFCRYAAPCTMSVCPHRARNPSMSAAVR